MYSDFMVYKKKDFYYDFYNKRFFRDFIFVNSNKNLKYDTESPYLPYDPNVDFKRNIINFLLKKTNPNSKIQGSFYSQLTYYRNISDLRIKNESDRFCNCLFFDFDADNEKLHDLKIDIKRSFDDLTGKDRIKRINEIQNEYQNLLFTSDVLDKSFADAKKLYDFFKSNNINCYTVFSGSKGIHLYLFFDECKLINYSEISNKLAESYKSTLNLSTLDLAVNKDAIARKSRVIYSKHETSNLFVTPFDIESESITDVLEKSRKQKPEPFVLDNYIIKDNDFVDVLKSIDNNVQSKNEIIIAEKKKFKNHSVNNGNVAIADADKDSIFSDMRILLKLILGEPEKEFKKYNSYLCPFHDDNSPSARVYEKNFLCASENLHLNYFDFIRKYYNLESDDEVKEKMKELKNLVMDQ